MPLPQNINVIIGAGVFGIVCAAALYVMERQRQDRTRHTMSRELALVHSEMAVLRKELDVLQAQRKQKLNKRSKKGRKSETVLSASTTTEDYASAVDGDSSDLEFYDVSDDEVDARNLDSDLEQIDKTLDEGNATDIEACVKQLQNLCLEHPENPQLLWRLGKAHYKLFTKTEQQEHLVKGIEACTLGLSFTPELASVHKWMAILVGERTHFQPLKDKILDGHLFKKHVDAAVRLDPSDATLHHMLGRFAYDIAELKWYEKKVAAALWAEPPSATYEEALNHFLEADRLAEKEWKENLLYIAKCQLKMSLIEEAMNVLVKALAIGSDNGVDDQVDTEIKELMRKHSR